MITFERRVVQTESGPISYREAGAGPPLLLMHGIGGNSRSWRHQLAGLADGFRVIAWDAPGYGESARRSPTLSGYAGAVADLLSVLGVDCAHVLGHSMGGVVAQSVAGLMPGLVGRLILSGTFTGDAAASGTPLGERLTGRLEDRRRLTPEAFGQARAAAMLASAAQPATRAEAAGIAGEVPYEGLLDGCRLLHHADTRPLLTGLSIPVLVIVGAEDGIVPPAKSEAIVALVPSCRTARITAAGHAAYLERPEHYNAVVREFLTA